MSLHVKRPLGIRKEFFPAFDENGSRKQRFLVYTAVSTKRWQSVSAEFEPFETNSLS